MGQKNQQGHSQEWPKYLSSYDFQQFTVGYSKCEDVAVGSGTLQLVCVYSPGWIPFKIGHAKYKASQIHSLCRAPLQPEGQLWHAKIRHQRQDALHKFSTALVRNNAAIFVGDVASAKLVKTKMAKSTLDAGWAMLKTMLEYKSHQAGIVFMEINEAYTTQTCSCYGAIPASSPKGRTGLRIREWTCSECETTHDRDINAARNILTAGHRRLAVGISVL